MNLCCCHGKHLSFQQTKLPIKKFKIVCDNGECLKSLPAQKKKKKSHNIHTNRIMRCLKSQKTMDIHWKVKIICRKLII